MYLSFLIPSVSPFPGVVVRSPSHSKTWGNFYPSRSTSLAKDQPRVSQARIAEDGETELRCPFGVLDPAVQPCAAFHIAQEIVTTQ